MTFNEDLKAALRSQIDVIEKHIEENEDEMIKLQERIADYAEMNKEHMAQIRKLAARIREM